MNLRVITFRSLFFTLFCLFGAGGLFAQTEETVHRFAWTGAGDIVQYEVQIEQEEAGEEGEEGVFVPFLQDFTDEAFFYVALPPGLFRLRVVPHGAEGLIGDPSQWSYFSVFPPAPPVAPVILEPPHIEYVAAAAAEAAAPPAVVHLRMEQPGEFFAGFLLDSAFFGRDGAAFGGGALFGRSLGRTGYGASLLFARDSEAFTFVEMLVLFRLHIPLFDIDPGFFVQAEAGIVTFNHREFQPDNLFAPSLGMRAGWSIPFADQFQLEPSIRFGFPFIFGAGVSATLRF